MKKFLHGLGTVLMFIGLIYGLTAFVVLFQAFRQPRSELGNSLTIFAILLVFGALVAVLGEHLRLWTEGKPGWWKQRKMKRANQRSLRELTAVAETAQTESPMPAADAAESDAPKPARQTAQTKASKPAAKPSAPAPKSPAENTVRLASVEDGYWTVIAPYLNLPLHDGENFYLFESAEDAQAYIEAAERPELTVRELRGDFLRRELSEYLCCGYKSAVIRRTGRAALSWTVHPSQLRVHFDLPAPDRFGNILPHALYRMHNYLNQVSYSLRKYPEGSPEFWRRHLADYKGDVIRYLLVSRLCLPARKGEDGDARFAVPEARMPSGRRYVALFTDQFAIDRYMGRGEDSIVFPGLLSDVAGKLRAGEYGDVDGIMVNPGREEFKMTADEIAEQEAWLESSSESLAAHYRETPPKPANGALLRFSGNEAENTAIVDIVVQPSGEANVSLWHGGTNHGAVGTSMGIPQTLLENYTNAAFIEWLRPGTEPDGAIEIVNPIDEEDVRRFLSRYYSPRREQ